MGRNESKKRESTVTTASPLKLTLNLGCGGDSWGDVRMDIDYYTQTRVKSKLNLRADAHQLPFITGSFSMVRCRHVLEHCHDPRKVINEIKRVGDHFELRFPYDDGYKRELLYMLSNLSISGIIQAYQTRKKGFHVWILRPSSGRIAYYRLFDRWFSAGRKSRYLRIFLPFLPRVRHEWILST